MKLFAVVGIATGIGLVHRLFLPSTYREAVPYQRPTVGKWTDPTGRCLARHSPVHPRLRRADFPLELVRLADHDSGPVAPRCSLDARTAGHTACSPRRLLRVPFRILNDISAQSFVKGGGEERAMRTAPDRVSANEEDEAAEDAEDRPHYIWYVSVGLRSRRSDARPFLTKKPSLLEAGPDMSQGVFYGLVYSSAMYAAVEA
jgi:hypothetical protein